VTQGEHNQAGAMTPCKGVEQVDSFRVKVTVAKTFAEIVRPVLRYCCYGFLYSVLCFAFFFLIVGVYLLLRAQCYLPPELELRALAVHNMTVTTTTLNTTTTETPIRELDYSVDITLAMRNPNKLPGCAIKYRRVVVSTAYRGDVLQRYDVPAAYFLQKRGRTREVMAPMQGEHVGVNQTNAAFLEGEVRNRNVLMEVWVDTRFRTSERRTKWSRLKCDVIVSTPSPSQTVGLMMYHKCSVLY
jgi:hypothetical protein